MSPDELQSLATTLLALSGELAVTAKTLSEAGKVSAGTWTYGGSVRRVFRTHMIGLVRRYSLLVCPNVPASTVRDFEELFGGTFDEATTALDRLNSEILRR